MAKRSKRELGETIPALVARREHVERRWFKHQTPRNDLSTLVTGVGLADEPFHRWLSYKQAFSPGLVRKFLKQAEGLIVSEETPLLDPFSGTGTFVVECSRKKVPARGIEAIPAMAFLACAKGEQSFAKMPNVSKAETWQQMADLLEHPLHRAALILAVASLHTTDGKPMEPMPPLVPQLAKVLRMMREDLEAPLPLPIDVEQGDARTLETIEDESIGGILTSPPYLSRHDYTKTTRPHEAVYQHWYQDAEMSDKREAQVRAHPKAYQQAWSRELPASVLESADELKDKGEAKLAGVVRSYFEDMSATLQAFHRVLAVGAPCWIVVGGARLRDVYVPADTILAEIADKIGFRVTELLVARRLIGGGRNFGTLTDVSPREAIVVLEK